MNIYAAYGSAKDINVYQSAGIPLSRMYIVKPKNPKRKHQVQVCCFLSFYLFMFGRFIKLADVPVVILFVIY